MVSYFPMIPSGSEHPGDTHGDDARKRGKPARAEGDRFGDCTIEATGSDLIATVNYHRYAKQSSAYLWQSGLFGIILLAAEQGGNIRG